MWYQSNSYSRALLHLQGGLLRDIRFTPVSKFFSEFRPSLQVVISVCDWPCVLWQLHRCLQELRCSDVPSMKATEMFQWWTACISKAVWLSLKLLAAAFTEDDTETLIVLLALIFARPCGPVQLGVSWMRFKCYFAREYCGGDRRLSQQGCSTSEKTPTLIHIQSRYILQW